MLPVPRLKDFVGECGEAGDLFFCGERGGWYGRARKGKRVGGGEESGQ